METSWKNIQTRKTCVRVVVEVVLSESSDVYLKNFFLQKYISLNSL